MMSLGKKRMRKIWNYKELMWPHRKTRTDSGWSSRNMEYTCYVITVIVKWQDTEEDTELNTWFYRTLFKISGHKRWQDMWQEG